MFYCPIDSYAFTKDEDLFEHLVKEHKEFTAHLFLFLSHGLMHAIADDMTRDMLELMPEERMVRV